MKQEQLLFGIFVLLNAVLSIPAFAQWKSLGAMTVQSQQGNQITFSNRDAMVAVQALAPDLIRVRMHVGKNLDPDYSWAVIKTEWPFVDVKFSGDKQTKVLKTAALEVKVQLSPFQVSFYDTNGRLISSDARAMGWDGARVRAWKTMPGDEHYFGLGEKAGPVDKRGHSYIMWNSDPAGYDALTDPMYQTVPFFMGIKDGLAYGIFFDNTYRSTFDMGAEATTSYSFGADGGDLNYYFFSGPEPKQIITRYTELVGRTALPPMWSIGYLQSSAHYYPESTVRFVASNFRQRHIPCDGIFLDLGHMDGYRVFTWDKKGFPDPSRMIADLRKDGFHLFAITDPGVKKDDNYWVYRQGVAGNHFLRRKNGELYIGNIWPGPSAFPDFTSETARDWWGSLFEGLVRDGIAGFLTDMDEPTVNTASTDTEWKPAGFPEEVIYDDHGLHSPASKIHNIFGLLMSRATRDGLLRFRPNERPFVITRATYAGGQRYAAQWTGDNLSTWEDLRASLRIVMSSGISGMPFTGSDTGGFIGFPTAELYTRWMQAGVFHPFFFTHTANEHRRLDPWSFGNEFEQLNRRALELRYRLLPYLYNAFYQSTQTGLPIMRALVLDYPGDRRVMDLTPDSQTYEFLYGNSLLVAPVVREGETQRDVYLPKGDWYDFWSGKHYAGPATITVDAPLSYIPMFARGGGFIPMRQVVEYSNQAPINPLTFEIYPEGDVTHEYYEDDGTTLDYERGGYLRQKVHVVQQDAKVTVTISAREGSYVPADRALILKIHGMQQPPRSIVVDGKTMQVNPDLEVLGKTNEVTAYDVDSRTVWIKVRDRSTGLEIQVED